MLEKHNFLNLDILSHLLADLHPLQIQYQWSSSATLRTWSPHNNNTFNLLEVIPLCLCINRLKWVTIKEKDMFQFKTFLFIFLYDWYYRLE